MQILVLYVPIPPFSAGWATEGRLDCKNDGCWFVDGDNLTGALHVL